MTIKDTLQEIDSIAQEYNGYDYGLPIHSEDTLNNMEIEIKKLIEFHVKAALQEASGRDGKYFILNAYPLTNIK